MGFSRKVKKLDQDLTAAIEWIAVEFDSIQQLKQEIRENETVETDINKKKLNRALKLLIYISRAERRAFRLEERIGKNLKTIYEELSSYLELDLSVKQQLINQIRSTIKELNIERDNLLKYAARYNGLLKTELTHAEAEAQLLADLQSEYTNPKAKKIHLALLNFLRNADQQIEELDHWASASEATLKKAKEELVPKLEQDLIHLLRHSSVYQKAMELIPPSIRGYVRGLNYELASLYQYHRLDMFNGIAIETTSICNRKCSYCPNADKRLYSLRPKKVMDPELFKLIIDQLAQIDFRGVVALQHYGEPLLDEKLEERIQYTRTQLKHAQIEFNSNGDFLTIDKLQKLVKSGLSRVRVTNHNTNGLFSSTMQKTITHLESNPSLKRYIVIRNGITTLYNRGGLVDIPEDKKRILKHCIQETHNLNVDVEGNVVLCASDYLGTVNLGNVATKNILDIWYSEKYRRIRQELRTGIFTQQICQNCTS